MSEVLHHLKARGEDNEVFITSRGSLVMRSKSYNQKEIRILKTYRFEGESDPADQAIIYLLEADDGTIGYCIDGYGLSSSHTNDVYGDFISQAKVSTSYLSANLYKSKHQFKSKQ